MSWEVVAEWIWRCDVCPAVSVESDDREPEGWTHGQDGLDRCPTCVRAAWDD